MIASQNTLTRKQCDTLLLLGAMLPREGARVRPGYEYERFHAAADRIGISPPMPTGLVGPAKELEQKGLVEITGVAYGAKTYALTSEGFALARIMLAELPACSCPHGVYVDKSSETWDEMSARAEARDACDRHRHRRPFGKLT